MRRLVHAYIPNNPIYATGEIIDGALHDLMLHPIIDGRICSPLPMDEHDPVLHAYAEIILTFLNPE